MCIFVVVFLAVCGDSHHLGSIATCLFQSFKQFLVFLLKSVLITEKHSICLTRKKSSVCSKARGRIVFRITRQLNITKTQDKVSVASCHQLTNSYFTVRKHLKSQNNIYESHLCIRIQEAQASISFGCVQKFHGHMHVESRNFT